MSSGDATVTLTASLAKGGVSDTKSFPLIVLALPSVDDPSAEVAAAKAALVIGYATGDSASSVTRDLTLPASGANLVMITWASSASSVVSSTGSITRPAAGSSDATVTLTATIAKSTASDTKAFVITVKALTVVDDPAADVANAKAALAIGFASGDSASSVTQDLTLPSSGTDGVAISWSSNTPSVVSAQGKVTRPVSAPGNVGVTLTATLSKGGLTDTKTFMITVKVLTVVDDPVADVANAKAVLAIGFSSGDSASSVTQNLTLPTSGGKSVTVSWTTSASSVVTATGSVTRPAAGSPDATITLTATLAKSTASDTKDFVITVKALTVADDPAADVANAKAALAIGFASDDSASSVTQDLTLPASGANLVMITWASSASSVVSPSGVVTRPAAGQSDANVTLTATLSKGGSTDTKAFAVTVKALPVVDDPTADVAAAKAALAIVYASGDGASSVTQNLTLPTSGDNSVTVSWTTSASSVVSSTGSVTRPAAGSSDATVTLTATLAKSTASDTKAFVLTVKALPVPGAIYDLDGTWRKTSIGLPSDATALAAKESALVCQLSDESFEQWAGSWTATLAKAPSSFVAMAYYGNALWGASSSGSIYAWDGTWRAMPALPVGAKSLSAWGSGLAALGTDGRLYQLDGTWKLSPVSPPAGALSIARSGSTDYALGADGTLYRLDGLWLSAGTAAASNASAIFGSATTLYLVTK